MIGADSTVAVEPIRRARQRYGHTLAVAWFSTAGLLRPGQPLAAVLSGTPRIGGGRAALIGARTMSPDEWRHVWEGRVRYLPARAARVPAVVSSCLLETDPDEVYVHISLDVLDPGGLTAAELTAGVRALARAVPVVGTSIASGGREVPEALAELVT